MAQAKIYKVRVWTNRYETRGSKKGQLLVENTKEHVFVGKKNLKTAKDYYRSELSEHKHLELYGETINVQLFEPHIFNDGKLAYWPDDNKYIHRYKTGEHDY